MTVNFADLCTLANCSVLIMTDKYHGYYIHGKAPWAKSDLPMSWLKLELDMEADNKRRPRAMGTEAQLNDARSLNTIGNTYEIFMQPTFRQNFDSWRDTPLENMDNRNLSEKEKQTIDDNKRASMAHRSRKDADVVQESNMENELNEQGLSTNEVKIVRQERKKRIVNHMLCQTFHLVDEKKFNNITVKTWWERLVQSSPLSFAFGNEDPNQVPFHLVRDKDIKFPAFERHLYCHLDYDMLILIICFVNLIDQLTNNPMLAICVAYFIERFFRWLRGFLGEKNIVKKTYTDDCFLL